MRAIITLVLFLNLVLLPLKALAGEPVQKEWTLIVFLNGHNNLDPFGAKDINEMEQIGSTADSNIVVQWASLKAPNTKRLLIQKDQNTTIVSSPTVENLPRIDMGDYKELVNFIAWAVKNYPAKHYMIDVWNHGAGWILNTEPEARGISYDDLTGNHITTEELALAMSEAKKIIGHKVDIYASDACLMAMAEIAVQMKDSVAYFGGSEETEPADGWPYEKLLPAFKKNATAPEILTTLTREYVAHYKALGQSRITFSAYDLAYSDELTASIKDLIPFLRSKPKKELQGASRQSTRFAEWSYTDLLHLAKILKLESKIEPALKKFVIANDMSTTFKAVGGVAVWLPTYKPADTLMERYKLLEFHLETGWGDATKLFLE